MEINKAIEKIKGRRVPFVLECSPGTEINMPSDFVPVSVRSDIKIEDDGRVAFLSIVSGYRIVP